MIANAQAIITRCSELKTYWSPRDQKMKVWWRLIQMIDELKTDKMESFVGNDARAMFNLVLHLLDSPVPHRLKDVGDLDQEASAAGADVSRWLETAWDDVSEKFRKSGPRQSLKRTLIGYMIGTGWYSCWSVIGDDGKEAWFDLWSPAETYPMWDSDMGLSEVAHIFTISEQRAKMMAVHQGYGDLGVIHGDQPVYDYWWLEMENVFPYQILVYNACVLAGKLVKYEVTRFKKIPVYISPVGGLPDTGSLSTGTELASTFSAGAQTKGDRWKEEIGQSVVATNENIYRSWNKWWSFSLQLLRDTAQPKIFERSRTGKAIVKPEDVFRRGAIFRGGPDDAVDFLSPPPIPLELRSTQLDLEAMMQRGGVSWALYGNVTGQMTAYVMSQIAASANQVMRPYQQALQYLIADIDNDWLQDVRDRGVHPYGFTIPRGFPRDGKITADFDIEIPGDLVQRATVARMIDPNFRLSYRYTVSKLFPEIKDPLQEKAMVRADDAERDPRNALIAYIDYCRKQAAYLEKVGDSDNAELYRMAGESALATLAPAPTPEQRTQGQPAQQIGNRPEGNPPLPNVPIV